MKRSSGGGGGGWGFGGTYTDTFRPWVALRASWSLQQRKDCCGFCHNDCTLRDSTRSETRHKASLLPVCSCQHFNLKLTFFHLNPRTMKTREHTDLTQLFDPESIFYIFNHGCLQFKYNWAGKGWCALFIHSKVTQMNWGGNWKSNFLFFTAPACQGNLLRLSPQEVQVCPHTERNKKGKRWKSHSHFCQVCWPDDTHVTYLFSRWPWWSQMTFRALENKTKPQLFLGKNKWAFITFFQS